MRFDTPRRFVAKRHKRASGFGWTVIHYRSSDHMGLINLDGTVVTPSPFPELAGPAESRR